MTQPAHLHDPLTGQHLTFLQTGRDTAGELLQLEVLLDSGGWVPRHAHVRQDERVEVLLFESGTPGADPTTVLRCFVLLPLFAVTAAASGYASGRERGCQTGSGSDSCVGG